MVCFGTYLLLYETVCCIAGLLRLPPQLQILFCLKTTVYYLCSPYNINAICFCIVGPQVR
uniref:Macaca fascicularis brain cDNA clone: QflA-22190, similar to human CWF19-like 2, cell cycle control (S. pombe) (CWF19L2), mRNA, RefSeq: NM_152434.1 n=1 Tax=Macaca fascicularis TaxID=9541 RepID=I7GNS5_MACFA|nr:unnamed protein product [Macaca fascicularis]